MAGWWRLHWILCAAMVFSAMVLNTTAVEAQEKVEAPASQFNGLSEKVIAAFNAGKADQVAALFSPDGEWIDESGAIYQGREEIQSILTEYFEKYQGAKLEIQVESVRIIGPVAIEEGSREVQVGESGAKAIFRYIAVLAKGESGWQIVSLRDFDSSLPPTCRELLHPLSWLVGNWVNEGVDATVEIQYKWSEDGNFLLGEYVITRGGEAVLKCSQRIGWDPLVGAPRSWMFDSDGGFSEGRWTPVEEGWVIKSQAVLPDASTGSATITMKTENNDRFTMTGTERIAGGDRDEDFHVVIVRKLVKSATESE
ncbi:MAG TPA: SgcJ/EcaC family oxidoreductase [Planctomicrobium sp.]|nr:SgcJ/EcaC family oxidoreductase [Planctomicrobium sp.]